MARPILPWVILKPHGGAGLLGVVQGGGTIGSPQLGQSGAGGAQLDVEDLASGVGNLTLGIVGIDVVQRVQSVLVAQVLEEVLLPPAIEHAPRYLEGG
jgi:hypothetical protein